nr:restriction endonuclease subunit S [Aristophania vespae]
MKAHMRYMEKLLEGVEVEWKPLGEVLIANIGGGTPSKAEQAYWSGTIPWASVGDLSIDDAFVERTRNYITDEGLKKSSSNLIPKGSLIVAIKISPGKVKIAGDDIAINQDLRGLILKNCILNKYLYYYLNTVSFLGNGTIVKSVTSKYLEKIEIPILPLHIQSKIVQILDTFTALTAELRVELRVELTARKKQYNYYREKLLQFGADVEWKSLGEVATLKRGRVMSKNYLFDNYGPYPVYSSQTARNGKIGNTDNFDFDGEYVSWTTDGANAGTVFYRKGKFSITNVCGLIEIKNVHFLLHKFLFYWLSIEAKKHVYTGMGNPKLMSHQVSKIPIPYPHYQNKNALCRSSISLTR